MGVPQMFDDRTPILRQAQDDTVQAQDDTVHAQDDMVQVPEDTVQAQDDGLVLGMTLIKRRAWLPRRRESRVRRR